ncbi:MAG TPA: methyltransferase domain-containing protein [Ignavibacteriaceae bacterium]|nr:methyltransferase domain-containing protein [Ignavibacteriaceae bacterium]
MNNTDNSYAYPSKNSQLDEACWDMKPATPAFIELINSKTFIQPGKLLVTGSGKCYDAIAASKAGYEVTASGLSSEEIFYSKLAAQQNNAQIDFLVDDILLMCNSFNESFDAIYDYSSYSTVNDILLEEYIRKISSLLRDGGKFIAILFPVNDKGVESPGGISLPEFYSITKKYLQLEYSSRRIISIKSREGKEAMQIYVKN